MSQALVTEHSDSPNTFWRLVTTHRIEIPIIQRDYAQGRQDKKAEQIRSDFVSALLQALITGRRLHLDFVYGKLKGKEAHILFEQNKQSIEALLAAVKGYAQNLSVDVSFHLNSGSNGMPAFQTCLVPLDGQQRLTTLFLLHWYFSFRCADPQQCLGQFGYNTRTSSAAFCKRLVENTASLQASDKSIFSLISDAVWFSSSWLNDPTIAGMLRMLDELERQINRQQPSDGDLALWWNRLKASDVIYFDFLDLDELKLEDELYVKMNARGKPLTTYENFKAWLTEYIDEQGLSLKRYARENSNSVTWSEKLDIEWTDLFWENREDNDIDDARMGYFKTLAFFDFAIGVRLVNNKFTEEDAIIAEQLQSYEETPTTFFKDKSIFTQQSLTGVFDLLYFFEGDGVELLDSILEDICSVTFIKKVLPEAFFQDILGLSYPDKVLIFSISRFVLQKQKKLAHYDWEDRQQLRRWVRVCRNLIYNARIDSQQDLIRAVQSINDLSVVASTIVESLKNDRLAIPYFTDNQVKEERLKAAVLDEEWEPIFEKYEDHEYFYGQIGFLIELSEGRHDRFRFYAEKAGRYFSAEVLKDSEHKLKRALLCINDYLIDKKDGRFSFCMSGTSNSRERDENWREVFNDTTVHQDEKRNRRTMLKMLLDDTRSLEEIIADGRKSVTDWRRHFIQYPAIIEYCQQRMIYWREGTNGCPPNITLLGQSQLNHKHAELYTYAVYLGLLERMNLPGDNPVIRYIVVRNSTDRPNLQVHPPSDTEAGLFELRYGADGGHFEIHIAHPVDEHMKIVSDRLASQGYVAATENRLLKTCEPEDVIEDVMAVLN